MCTSLGPQVVRCLGLVLVALVLRNTHAACDSRISKAKELALQELNIFSKGLTKSSSIHIHPKLHKCYNFTATLTTRVNGSPGKQVYQNCLKRSPKNRAKTISISCMVDVGMLLGSLPPTGGSCLERAATVVQLLTSEVGS